MAWRNSSFNDEIMKTLIGKHPFLSAERFHIQAEVAKVCFELKETCLGS